MGCSRSPIEIETLGVPEPRGPDIIWTGEPRLARCERLGLNCDYFVLRLPAVIDVFTAADALAAGVNRPFPEPAGCRV